MLKRFNEPCRKLRNTLQNTISQSRALGTYLQVEYKCRSECKRQLLLGKHPSHRVNSNLRKRSEKSEPSESRYDATACVRLASCVSRSRLKISPLQLPQEVSMLRHKTKNCK